LRYPYINGQEINVHGSIINNFNDALNRYKLAKNSSILLQDTQKWYPINEFQSLFASLEKQYDQQLLIEIGKNVPTNSIFPTDVDSFEKGLFGLNTAYKLNHRNGIDGYYKILCQDRREIIVICNTFFYPASFNMGIISGLAEKFNIPVRIEELTNYKGGEFKVKLLSTF
jgi:hypothetical protein